MEVLPAGPVGQRIGLAMVGTGRPSDAYVACLARARVGQLPGALALVPHGHRPGRL